MIFLHVWLSLASSSSTWALRRSCFSSLQETFWVMGLLNHLPWFSVLEAKHCLGLFWGICSSRLTVSFWLYHLLIVKICFCHFWTKKNKVFGFVSVNVLSHPGLLNLWVFSRKQLYFLLCFRTFWRTFRTSSVLNKPFGRHVKRLQTKIKKSSCFLLKHLRCLGLVLLVGQKKHVEGVTLGKYSADKWIMTSGSRCSVWWTNWPSWLWQQARGQKAGGGAAEPQASGPVTRDKNGAVTIAVHAKPSSKHSGITGQFLTVAS